MQTDNQPLDNQPQGDDDTSFDDAFAEYAGGPGDDTSATDDDFEGGQGQDDGQDDQDHGQDDAQGQDDDLTPREREMQAQLERLRHSDASQRGRLGAYQRQINELQRQVQQRQGGGQQAPAGAQQPSPQQPPHGGQGSASDDQRKQDIAEEMGSDDWETFKEDFPDMARALEARLDADRQKYAHLEQRLAQYEPAMQSIQQQAQEQHLKAQEDALAARHPDWQKVVAAPEFAEWLNQQPESLQRLTQSEDAAEAAALLDMYQAQTGNAGPADSQDGTPDRRQQRLAAAQSPQRRGRARQGQVDDDFGSAFDHYAAKKAAR